MTGAIFPDITIDSPLEQTNLALAALIGNLTGARNYGVPQYELTGDYVDTGGVDGRFFRRYETTEPSFGSLGQWTVNSQLALQLDNAGISGAMPLDMANTGHFGGDLSTDQDLFVGQNAEITLDLLVGQNAHIVGELLVDQDAHIVGNGAIDGNLVVGGSSELLGHVGSGTAPDATVQFKNEGSFWNDGYVGIFVTPSGDFPLEVAGDVGPEANNARALGSAAKQWANIFTEGLTADSPTLVVDPTNHRVGLGIAAPLYATHGEGNLAWDVNASVPTFFVLDASHCVGIGSVTPQAPLDILLGCMRVGGTSTPSGGEGLELHWNPSTDTATILGFNRGLGTFGVANVNAQAIALMVSSASRINLNATGIGVFGTAGVAQQAVAAAATDLASAIALANSLRAGLRAYGWFP